MKKFLVILAILAIAATAAQAQFSYYKGINGDNWGVTPDSVTNNTWTVNQTGNNKSVNGCLWANISALPIGASIQLSFDLVSNHIAMPFPWGRNEGAGGGLWTEVYLMDRNNVTAQNCMDGSNGVGWTDRMVNKSAYNPYSWVTGARGYTGGGAQGWQNVSSWTNQTATDKWAGFDTATYSDTVHFTKTFTNLSSGNIFIGIKTGIYNSGGNNYAAGPMSQGVQNLSVQVLPEPSSILALGSGLIGMAGFVIRRRK